MSPRRTPRPEIVHQSDGRNLILLDGIVIAEIDVDSDETFPIGPPSDTIVRPEKRRIRLIARAINYGGWQRDGDELDVTIGQVSPRRFDDEIDYFDWINGPDTPKATRR